jgi:hypothetical protein
MILCRPVYQRASLTAFSFASAPPFVKNRGDDPRMLVAQRHVDELRSEVEVALPVVVPEVASLAPGHRDRSDRVLHRPRVEDVALRVFDDLLPELGVGLGRGHVPIL